MHIDQLKGTQETDNLVSVLIIVTWNVISLHQIHLNKILLNLTAAKKIVGFATIVRRPTPQETKDRIKRERKAALKEKFSNIGTALFAVIFFASIILGGFYASEHKEIFSVVGAIIGIGFILFLLFAVWSFVSESTTSKWKSALRTIGITILIIGVLLLIGYLMPDSCSNYVNDAHRPDRF